MSIIDARNWDAAFCCPFRKWGSEEVCILDFYTLILEEKGYFKQKKCEELKWTRVMNVDSLVIDVYWVSYRLDNEF